MTKRIEPDNGIFRRTVLKAGAVVAGAHALSRPASASTDHKDENHAADSNTLCGDVPDIETHTVTGGNCVTLRVDETGLDTGQPILFIHGVSGSRLHWDLQMHSDLGDDYRLVAVDLRGHGDSDKPEGEDAYQNRELWAADIQAVIDELNLNNPVLVGWSGGAWWIADYLSVHGDDEIAGVNLIGPAPSGFVAVEDLTEIIGAGFLELVGSGGLTSTDVEESIAALEEFIPLLTAEPVSPQDHYFLLGIFAVVPPRVRGALLAREDFPYDRLPEIESPFLLTHGEKDEILLPRASEVIAERVLHARTSFYPNVGHAVQWENADRFNRELREFVAGL